jgi:hypothetical protein
VVLMLRIDQMLSIADAQPGPSQVEQYKTLLQARPAFNRRAAREPLNTLCIAYAMLVAEVTFNRWVAREPRDTSDAFFSTIMQRRFQSLVRESAPDIQLYYERRDRPSELSIALRREK